MFFLISLIECENYCNNNSGCKGIGYILGFFGVSLCELLFLSFYEFGFLCLIVFYVRYCLVGMLKYFKC